MMITPVPRFPACAPASAAPLPLIVNVIEPRLLELRLGAGEVVIEEGDPGEAAFIIGTCSAVRVCHGAGAC